MKPADYSTDEAPADYVCASCGATNVKLWREYQTFRPTLKCLPCSEHEQGRTIDCDRIGWRVPAVPDEEGVGWWGYTSVPEKGVQWWHRLAWLPEWAAGKTLSQQQAGPHEP